MRRKKKHTHGPIVWSQDQKPTRVPRKSPRKGQGSIPSRPRKARVEAHVGRLAWACMSCREQAGNLGLAVRIRKLRMEQGVSLRDFGKKAGVHPFHVMAIELGQLAANTKTLRSIGGALGVAPMDLLNHDTDGDDLGRLVELMRTQPDAIKLIKQRVEPLVKN